MTHTATIKPTIFAEILWKCRSFKTPRHPPQFCSALHNLQWNGCVEAILVVFTKSLFVIVFMALTSSKMVGDMNICTGRPERMNMNSSEHIAQ
jgi:hypothetical protein